jgi:type VI secretion system secreted protein Hcp
VPRASTSTQEYYKVTFEDCLISSVQHSGGGEIPTESFAINFAKYQFEYCPQKEDGSLDSPVISKYDLKASKK